MDSRKKKLTQYVVPTILGNCAYFLFTIIDGIFVGQGVGTDALGAVNLVWPFEFGFGTGGVCDWCVCVFRSVCHTGHLADFDA